MLHCCCCTKYRKLQLQQLVHMSQNMRPRQNGIHYLVQLKHISLPAPAVLHQHRHLSSLSLLLLPLSRLPAVFRRQAHRRLLLHPPPPLILLLLFLLPRHQQLRNLDANDATFWRSSRQLKSSRKIHIFKSFLICT